MGRMPTTVRRPPWGSVILLLAIAALIVRSLICRDTLEWCGVHTDANSIVIVTSGVSCSRLGLGFFRRQNGLAANDRNAARAVDAAPLGFRWNAEPLPDHPSLLRRLGLGLEREVHDEPGSYRDRFELTVPLWLLGMAFVIAPARFILAWRRRRANMGLAGRPRMKYGLAIGIACGVIIGAVATFMLVSRSKEPSANTSSTQSGAPSSQAPPPKAPIHPIVGTWRVYIDPPMAAIYRFENDGTFALTIKPMPRFDLRQPVTHEAGGTWKVQGNALVMTNTMSNTPLTVVGETESATIVSVDADTLVLDTTDRDGKPQTLRFEHIVPFAAGRYDNAGLPGKWQSPAYEMELLASGDVVMTRAAWKGGKWPQQGKRLWFVLDPPYVRSAARRMADPALTAPVEQEFDFRLSADNNTLMLVRKDVPNYPVQQFRRLTATGTP